MPISQMKLTLVASLASLSAARFPFPQGRSFVNLVGLENIAGLSQVCALTHADSAIVLFKPLSMLVAAGPLIHNGLQLSEMRNVQSMVSGSCPIPA